MAIEAGGAYDNTWMYNGGYATLASYERNGADPTIHLKWFEGLPLVYDTPNIIFCHAGLTHPKLKNNRPYDLLWGRSWLNSKKKREKQVIFGHTPKKDCAYTVPSGDICIDAGCVFGGNLCALVIEESGESMFVYEKQSGDDRL